MPPRRPRMRRYRTAAWLFAGALFSFVPGVSWGAEALSPLLNAPGIFPEGPAAPRMAIVDRVGDRVIFSVDPAYDLTNRSSVTGTLVQTSERAYAYVETEYLEALIPTEREAFLEQVRGVMTEFDGRIYPVVTETFGTPWEPGIDGDARVTVFLARLTEATAGYFNPRDEYERSYVPESNEREMIYLNTRFIPGGRGKMFLAHEFQHLISFYWKDKLLGKGDDVWLNELRSEYVPTLLGYDAIYNGSNLEHRVTSFLRNANDSLTEWRNTPQDYGPVALFAQYLADQYSGTFFREVMRARTTGIPSVESALVAIGRAATFEDVFANWTIANYVNDINVNSAYGYFNPRLRTFRLLSTEIGRAPSDVAFSTKDWANAGFHLFGDATGAVTVRLEPLEVPASLRASVVRIEGGQARVTRVAGESGGVTFTELLAPNATLVILPFSRLVSENFTENDSARQMTLKVSPAAGSVPTPTLGGVTPTPTPTPFPGITPAPAPRVPEGSLIRARGDYKVYITKGQFRRHIVSPDIFGFYGHLGFAKVIDISPEELAAYKPSAWVRADGDPRVYEINGDGTKHWINIPGEQFVPSGRDWNGVYIINARERDWYTKGADVLR